MYTVDHHIDFIEPQARMIKELGFTQLMGKVGDIGLTQPAHYQPKFPNCENF